MNTEGWPERRGPSPTQVNSPTENEPLVKEGDAVAHPAARRVTLRVTAAGAPDVAPHGMSGLETGPAVEDADYDTIDWSKLSNANVQDNDAYTLAAAAAAAAPASPPVRAHPRLGIPLATSPDDGIRLRRRPTLRRHPTSTSPGGAVLLEVPTATSSSRPNNRASKSSDTSAGRSPPKNSNIDSALQQAAPSSNAARLFKEELELEEEAEEELEAFMEDDLERARAIEAGFLTTTAVGDDGSQWRISAGTMADLTASKHQTDFGPRFGGIGGSDVSPIRAATVGSDTPTKASDTRFMLNADLLDSGDYSSNLSRCVPRFNDLSASVEIGVNRALTKRGDFTGGATRSSIFAASTLSDSKGKSMPQPKAPGRSLLRWPWSSATESHTTTCRVCNKAAPWRMPACFLNWVDCGMVQFHHSGPPFERGPDGSVVIGARGIALHRWLCATQKIVDLRWLRQKPGRRSLLMQEIHWSKGNDEREERRRLKSMKRRAENGLPPEERERIPNPLHVDLKHLDGSIKRRMLACQFISWNPQLARNNEPSGSVRHPNPHKNFLSQLIGKSRASGSDGAESCGAHDRASTLSGKSTSRWHGIRYTCELCGYHAPEVHSDDYQEVTEAQRLALADHMQSHAGSWLILYEIVARKDEFDDSITGDEGQEYECRWILYDYDPISGMEKVHSRRWLQVHGGRTLKSDSTCPWSCTKISADGNYLAAVEVSSKEYEPFHSLKEFEHFRKQVRQGSAHVASDVSIYDANSGLRLGTVGVGLFGDASMTIRCLRWLPSMRGLVVGTDDGLLVLLHLHKHGLNSPEFMDLSYKEKLAVIAEADFKESVSKTVHAKHDQPEKRAIVEIAISNDGRLLATGGKDMRFFVYELALRPDGTTDLKVRWSHSNKMGRIYAMDWRPRPVGENADVKRHCEAKGRAAPALDLPPYQLAVGSDDNYLRVYEIPYVDTIEEIEYVEDVPTEHHARHSHGGRDGHTSSDRAIGHPTLTPIYEDMKDQEYTITIAYLSRKDEGPVGTVAIHLIVDAHETVWSVKSKLCEELFQVLGTKPDPSGLLMTCNAVQLDDVLKVFELDINGSFAAMRRRQLRYITPMYDSMDDSDYFQDYLRAVRYTNNGMYLVTASGHKGPGRLIIFNAEAMEPIQSYKLKGKVNPQGIQVGVLRDTLRHSSAHQRAGAAKDKSVFLVANLEGGDVKEVTRATVFNTLNSSSTEPMVPLHAVHRTGIKSVVFSQSGSVIACGSEGGSVSIFNVNSHEMVKKYSVGMPNGCAPVVAMHFVANEERLIVACSGSSGGFLRLVDLYPRVTLQDIKVAFYAAENMPVLQNVGRHTFVNAERRVELLHYAMKVETYVVASRRTTNRKSSGGRRGKNSFGAPFGQSWSFTDNLKRDLLSDINGELWAELAVAIGGPLNEDTLHIVNVPSVSNHILLDNICSCNRIDVEEALSHATHATSAAVAFELRKASQQWADEALRVGVLPVVPRDPGLLQDDGKLPAPWVHDQVQASGFICGVPRISTLIVSSRGQVLVAGYPRIKGGPPLVLLPSQELITQLAGCHHAEVSEISGAQIALPPPARDKGGGAGAVHCATFSDDGSFFVCGTETGGVFMISVDDLEEPVWHKYVHKKAVFSIAYTATNDGRVASGGRDKLIVIFSAYDGQEIQRIPEDHQGWVNALAFLPQGDLVSGSQDRTVRVYQEGTNYAVKDFRRRIYTFLANGGVSSIAHAPFGRGYDGMVAVGMADGKVQFVDLSMHHHQPTFHEAYQTVEYDKMIGNEDFVLTKEMVARFPYVVYSANYDGTTLLHVAAGASETAGQEGRSMSTLLSILLNAKTPKFWLPIDHVGQDPLRIAASVKMDRTAVEILLTHAIRMKNEKGGSRLSPAFSTLNDNLLVNLITLSMHYPDLVAKFLDDYGVDKAELSFEKSEFERRHIHNILKNTGYRFQADEQLFFGPESSLLGMDSEGLVVGRKEKRMRAIDWPMELKRIHDGQFFKNRHADDFKSQHSPRMTLVPMFIGIPLVAGTLPRSVCERISPGVAHTPESCIRMSMLHSFVMANDPSLFGSQIMRTVVQYKWETFAKREFYAEFLAHVLFVFLFTWMSILDANDRDWTAPMNSWDIFSGCAASFVIIYCARQLVSELRQARRLRQGREQSVWSLLFRYGSDSWNIIQTASYTLSIAAASMHLASGMNPHAHERLWNAKDLTGAVAGFLNWSSILYYLRPLQMFRGLVRTISLVIWRSLKFVAIYLIVLAGATNCMFLLYRNFKCTTNVDAMSCGTYPNRDCNETGGFVYSDRAYNWVEYGDSAPVILNEDGGIPPSCDTLYFSPDRTFWSTFFHTITVYVMGDIEQFVAQQDSYDEQHGVYSAMSVITRIIFLIFLFTLNIFMLNLMINLMDDILAQIHMEEGNAFNAERARVISEIEMRLPVDFVRKKEEFFPRWLHSLTMKRDNSNSTRWGGGVKAIQESNTELYKQFSRQVTESTDESRRVAKALNQKLDGVEGDLRRLTRLLEHMQSEQSVFSGRTSRSQRPSIRVSASGPT